MLCANSHLTMRKTYRAFGASLESHDLASEEYDLDDRKVVNVIIARSFNETHDDVQIQALEVSLSD